MTKSRIEYKIEQIRNNQPVDLDIHSLEISSQHHLFDNIDQLPCQKYTSNQVIQIAIAMMTNDQVTSQMNINQIADIDCFDQSIKPYIDFINKKAVFNALQHEYKIIRQYRKNYLENHLKYNVLNTLFYPANLLALIFGYTLGLKFLSDALLIASYFTVDLIFTKPFIVNHVKVSNHTVAMAFKPQTINKFIETHKYQLTAQVNADDIFFTGKYLGYAFVPFYFVTKVMGFIVGAAIGLPFLPVVAGITAIYHVRKYNNYTNQLKYNIRRLNQVSINGIDKAESQIIQEVIQAAANKENLQDLIADLNLNYPTQIEWINRLFQHRLQAMQPQNIQPKDCKPLNQAPLKDNDCTATHLSVSPPMPDKYHQHPALLLANNNNTTPRQNTLGNDPTILEKINLRASLS